MQNKISLFTPNIETKGRLLRFFLAIAFGLAAYFIESWILLAVSLFCLFEALMSWCVIRHFFGSDSCPL